MAVASWPETLPQFLNVDGYQEGFGEGRRFSATDQGPGKMFRKSAAIARPLSGAMVMTADQLSVFETFFHETVDEGSLPFWFPDPRGTGGDPILVRFAYNATPSWTSRGGVDFTVTLPLEALR